MNALQKALLIKELNQLIHDLEHRALSLYEIAKSKKRIKDIFALCDEPIFQKQILAYKAQIEPQNAVYSFAQSTPFSQSFRGYFTEELNLENILYTTPESGWAFLHSLQEGWQIWLIPAPNRTALISDWGNFEAGYAWLLKMQKHYTCLLSDSELETQCATLSNILESEIQLPPTTYSDGIASITPSTDQSIIETLTPDVDVDVDVDVDQHTDTFETTFPSHGEKSSAPEPDESAPLHISAEKQISPENETSTSLEEGFVAIPEQILLNNTYAQLHALPQPEAQQQGLYALSFPDAPEISLHANFILHCSALDTWSNHPVYIAEQVNAKGQLIKHLIILGAFDSYQAFDFAQISSTPFEYSLASLKQIQWETLASAYQQIETLFQCLEQAETVWNTDQYHPYMPIQAIHTQKFIQFAEQEADCRTPVLLLKERQKIRVIHGEKRLHLAQTEIAFPYLILHRQHGLNWQMIQSIISNMSQPINVHELYQSIQQQMTK